MIFCFTKFRYRLQIVHGYYLFATKTTFTTLNKYKKPIDNYRIVRSDKYSPQGGSRELSEICLKANKVRLQQ